MILLKCSDKKKNQDNDNDNILLCRDCKRYTRQEPIEICKCNYKRKK